MPLTTSVAQFLAQSFRYFLRRKVPGDPEATGGMNISNTFPESPSLHGNYSSFDVDNILSSNKSAGVCDIPDERLALVRNSSRKRMHRVLTLDSL